MMAKVPYFIFDVGSQLIMTRHTANLVSVSATRAGHEHERLATPAEFGGYRRQTHINVFAAQTLD